MGALTEVEIFDCMETNIKLAVQCCNDLAVTSRRGPTYEKLRTSLQLIEGCCRQASAWREDTRWLNLGLLMAEAHKRAGDWLRGYKVNGVRIKTADSQLNPLFVMLARNLEAFGKLAEQTRTARTGRLGMILPPELAPPTRTQGRQVQILVPPTLQSKKLILPASMAS